MTCVFPGVGTPAGSRPWYDFTHTLLTNTVLLLYFCCVLAHVCRAFAHVCSLLLTIWAGSARWTWPQTPSCSRLACSRRSTVALPAPEATWPTSSSSCRRSRGTTHSLRPTSSRSIWARRWAQRRAPSVRSRSSLLRLASRRLTSGQATSDLPLIVIARLLYLTGCLCCTHKIIRALE